MLLRKLHRNDDVRFNRAHFAVLRNVLEGVGIVLNGLGEAAVAVLDQPFIVGQFPAASFGQRFCNRYPFGGLPSLMFLPDVGKCFRVPLYRVNETAIAIVPKPTWTR